MDALLVHTQFPAAHRSFHIKIVSLATTEPYALHAIASVQDALDRLQHSARLVLTLLFRLQLEYSALLLASAIQTAFTVTMNATVVVIMLLTVLGARMTKYATMVETCVFHPVMLCPNISIFYQLELQNAPHAVLTAMGAMVQQSLIA